jgi:hypothetical protein
VPDPHPLHLPSSAEVARTLLAGQGTASLSHPLQDTEGSPVLPASRLDGTVVLALPHGGRVGRTDQPAPTQRTVAVSVRAQAALPDLTLPRFPFGRPLDDPETAWPAIASELTSHADNLATCPARSRPAGHRGRPVTGSTTGQDPPEPGQP